ncbi:MAG: hypothetical protein HYU27_06430 [Acidobacteria bacterium]|nr:hypothetical protein [Acidobacteriota bacterium]
MKASRIVVTLLVVLGFVYAPTPVRAQNFVEKFLSRYKPPKLELPLSPGARSQQQLAGLVRGSQLPLTVGDLINLMLENNLDVGVNRLTPRSSQYLIEASTPSTRRTRAG